mmetsp:Transcript_12905/g.37464  ORF Transcript_12905/g.37464 Transcript_12905/m.37464 type:complete len:471 (+) Transcript_12905:199-1611(+)
MSSKLKGSASVVLRHERRPYLYLGSIKGTIGIPSDGPAVLAGTQLLGTVALSFQQGAREEENFFEMHNVEAVVVVEGMERRFSDRDVVQAEGEGVSHPQRYKKRENGSFIFVKGEDGGSQRDGEISKSGRQRLLWRRHRAYQISHHDDTEIRFALDIPDDSPESFESYRIKVYEGVKVMHGDVCYFVQVAIFCDGKLAFHTAQPKKFLVASQPLPQPQDAIPFKPPIVATPVVRTIMKAGKLLMAIHLENERMCKGETCRLHFACRNLSRADINEVSIRVIERVLKVAPLSSSGGDDSANVVQTKKLGTLRGVNIPGVERVLGALQPLQVHIDTESNDGRDGHGENRNETQDDNGGRSGSDQNDGNTNGNDDDHSLTELNNDLMDDLSEPENTIRFQIPKGHTRCSFHGSFLAVEHFIQIKMTMKGIMYTPIRHMIPIEVVTSPTVLAAEDPATDSESDDDGDIDDRSVV